MTPNKINIAIAKSLGYRHIQVCDSWKKRGEAIGNLTNYHGSLDACVEMLAAIPEELWSEFIDNLEHECQISIGWSEMNSDDRMLMIKHTAPQLTTSYLKTIGKWK